MTISHFLIFVAIMGAVWLFAYWMLSKSLAPFSDIFDRFFHEMSTETIYVGPFTSEKLKTLLIDLDQRNLTYFAHNR